MNKILGSSPNTTTWGSLASILGVLATVTPEKYKPYVIAAASICGILFARKSKDSDGITKEEDVIVAKSATDGAIPPEENK